MTQVEIINLGLGHISQALITALSDGSTQADTATLVWTPCLQEVLKSNNWPCAAVIEALSEQANYTPPTGWSYAYTYPSNGIAVWKISNDYTDPTNKKGEDFREIYVPSLGTKVILTNTVDAVAEYTYNITDPTILDAAFVNVMAYRLAAAFAMPLNADADLAINMSKVYMNQLSEAQRQNSYENNVNNGQSPDAIVNSRMNGSTGQSVSIGGMTFDQFNQGG